MYLACDAVLKQMFPTVFLSHFETSLTKNFVLLYIYIYIYIYIQVFLMKCTKLYDIILSPFKGEKCRYHYMPQCQPLRHYKHFNVFT